MGWAQVAKPRNTTYTNHGAAASFHIGHTMPHLVEIHDNPNNLAARHYLTLNGQFVVAAPTLPALQSSRKKLDKHDWKFMRLTEDGPESPLALIAATRKAGHTFAASSSLTVSPRRSFFSGTISETSAHFCYMILDGSVADKIHARAPEVALHDFRANAPSATTRMAA